MAVRIPFNRPHVAGKELYYVARAVALGNIGSDGFFTGECQRLLQERLGIRRVLLTSSCTGALEMAALLSGLGPGDEVLMPSFTFVSTAAAVARTGATPVFVDVREDTLNLDETKLAAALTPHTRAIWPVHYAGVGCEMDPIMALANERGLCVVEDAAHAVNAFQRGRALGSIGHLGCFSFHETKNYVSGEGGALCVNDPRFEARAEILRDKGTNRQAFFRGEVDKYTWVDVGSSYVISELLSAFLLAQLELLDELAERRMGIWQRYREQLAPLEHAGLLRLPIVPAHNRSNAHNFYVLLPDEKRRDGLLDHLRSRGISAVFHYVPLHSAPMGLKLGRTPQPMPVTESVSARLLRLPLFYELRDEEVRTVCQEVARFLGA